MSQFLVFLANSFKELQDNNVLLLYVSADGIKEPVSEENLGNKLSAHGGVALNSRRSPEKQQTGINADCLYPEDLLVYTRKHLFLIVDSDNSAAFEVCSFLSVLVRSRADLLQNIPSVFGKQTVCLMSPRKRPVLDSESEEGSRSGNLFTLFLCDPLPAFCYVMNKCELSKDTYKRACEKTEEFLAEILQLLQTQPGIGILTLL